MKTQIAPHLEPVNTSVDPFRTLGIIGLVFGFLIPFIGLGLSFYAYRSSAKDGHFNKWAKWGVIVGGTFTAVIAVIAVAQWMGLM